jgi:hypothetical protein
VPVEVDRHHPDRTVGDPELHAARIEAERHWVDVGEHRGSTGQRDRVGGGGEREAGNDHLVTGADAAAEQPEVQPGRPGVEGHARSAEPEVSRELLLERRHLGPLGDHPGAEHPIDGGALLIADEGFGLRDERGHQETLSGGR